METTHTKQWVLCGIFAALAAIASQIAIPIQPVPINMATLAVFLAGGLLGAKYGAISQIVYVLLGAVGAPVFSLLRGGMGMIAGPTGGYIIGYIFAAWLGGFMLEHFERKTVFAICISMIASIVACYIFGTVWFIISMGSSIYNALMLCVVPFLPGDVLKICAGVIVVKRLAPVLRMK